MGFFLDAGFDYSITHGGNESFHKITEVRLQVYTGSEVFGPRLGPCMSGRATQRTPNAE